MAAKIFERRMALRILWPGGNGIQTLHLQDDVTESSRRNPASEGFFPGVKFCLSEACSPVDYLCVTTDNSPANNHA